MTRSADGPPIGGAPALRLSAPADPGRPCIVGAEVAPGRGMMLLQARASIPGLGDLDLLASPSLDRIANLLDGGPDDFAGNASFSLGGAVLLPFANRITGREIEGAREIETAVAGTMRRLPRNWSGKAPGARRYAMHGLILAEPFSDLERDEARLAGRRRLGDFHGRWPSSTEVEVEWRLEGGGLELSVTARNLGVEPLPVGIGWHPWFALPSGRRDQARLRLPASRRALANDYDEVLPTGEIVPVEGTPYDFRQGRALGGLYLDDCFTGLDAGPLTVELTDPASGLGLRLITASPLVKAVQVYAPLDRPVVVIEPQFNLADPFASVWPAGLDTGMAMLPPGGSADYRVRLELFAAGG
jgi:galactose mutarotase-like enzyme